MQPVFFEAKVDTLPVDRDARILLALRTLGVSGELGGVARTDTGKPYLPARPDVCFSVSHSGTRWLLVAADVPVGLDLQRRTDCRREQLARRFFHPDEVAYLEERAFEPFFAVWTARESYVKCRGTGLFRAPRSFSVVRDGQIAAPDGFSLRFLENGAEWWCAVTVQTKKYE